MLQLHFTCNYHHSDIFTISCNNTHLLHCVQVVLKKLNASQRNVLQQQTALKQGWKITLTGRPHYQPM